MECREELRLQGMPYPRSCELCGPQACKRTSLARVKELESRIADLEAEKAEREAQEPVPNVDPDWLSNVIRTVDGNNTMGAGALAEKIAEAINGRAK